jgi:hypothetical protein
VWHLSALASLLDIRLSVVAEANAKKLMHRLDRSQCTPLHDDEDQADEQFPREFAIELVTLANGRLQMFMDGKPLGDALTDNAYVEDGYRFHDALHIANAAKLGWSPVLRKMLRKKRRSDSKKDEVEDGARAMIVEEAVLKLIHSEGVRLAGARGAAANTFTKLIRDRDEISFSFLKLVRNMVAGLEVAQNRDWEWEDAILAGHELLYQLRLHGQGTVRVNLTTRRIEFDPSVSEFTLSRSRRPAA